MSELLRTCPNCREGFERRGPDDARVFCCRTCEREHEDRRQRRATTPRREPRAVSLAHRRLINQRRIST